MIERAVDRFEEGAAIGPVLGFAKTAGCVVQPRIRPRIVVAKHPEMRREARRHALQPAAACRATTRLRSHDPTAQPMT